MTPAEENALIVKVLADSGYQPDHDLDAAGILTIARLAIRAAVAQERERCAKIVGSYQVPVGNSPAGEMACEWTMDALREIAAAIRRGE